MEVYEQGGGLVQKILEAEKKFIPFDVFALLCDNLCCK